MGTRLGLTGTPRTFALATRSAALAAAGVAVVSLASSTSTTPGALASDGVGAASFVGRSTAQGALDSLGRTITGFVGGGAFVGNFAITGSGTFSARSSSGATALALSGTPGKRRTTSSHAPPSARLWGVNETLGVSLNISDFNRTFYLVETLGVSLAPTAFHGTGTLNASGLGTAAFGGGARIGGALAAAGTSTPDFGGAQVSVQSGVLGSAGTTTLDLRGTTAESVLGIGVLAPIGSGVFTPIAVSFDGKALAIVGTGAFAASGVALFSGVLSSPGVGTAEFFSSDNAALSSDGSSTTDFQSGLTRSAEFSISGSTTVRFAATGNRIGIAAITFVMTAPSMTFDMAAPEIRITLA